MATKHDQVNRELVHQLADLVLSESLSLFDCLTDTQFWIKDKDGRYLRINQTFQLGYSLTSMTSLYFKANTSEIELS